MRVRGKGIPELIGIGRNSGIPSGIAHLFGSSIHRHIIKDEGEGKGIPEWVGISGNS
jgi:hypothetical protein